MVKDKLFDMELTAADVLKDMKRDLEYFENAIRISEQLAAEEEGKKKEYRFDSNEYNDHSSMALIYKARTTVYKELKARLEDKLSCYEEE